jgi:hypothetical protein
MKKLTFDPKRSFIEEESVEVVQARFTFDPPPGYVAGETILFCRLTLMRLTYPRGRIIEQYWSAGCCSYLIPDDSGYRLQKVGSGRPLLHKESNFHHLMQSLHDAGFQDRGMTDLRRLLGLRMVLERRRVKHGTYGILVCARILPVPTKRKRGSTT